MTADPWLTEDGELHPALVKMGLPEWDDVELGLYLVLALMPESWAIRERDHAPEAFYHYDHDITDHEAHALIEKHAREWLLERGLIVVWSFGRSAYVTKEQIQGLSCWRGDIEPSPDYATMLQRTILAEGD